MSFLINVLNQSPKHIATWNKDVDDDSLSCQGFCLTQYMSPKRLSQSPNPCHKHQSHW